MSLAVKIIQSNLLCGSLFCLVGILHFVKPEVFLKIMPPVIPFHNECVFLSGVFEVLGGLGLCFAGTRRLASFGLTGLLIAVYPANIYMACRPDLFESIPGWLLFLRLPLQPLLALWVLRCGRK